MSQDATVNAGDIARLADVGRAAVSNWRRRYEDFPRPVGGTASSPLFSLPEVEEWLRRNGKLRAVSLGDRIWQRLRASAGDLRLGDLLGQVGAFLLFLSRDPEGWKRLAAEDDPAARLPRLLAEATPDLPVTAGGPRPSGELLRLIAEMAEREGAIETFEFLCERFIEVHSRRLGLTRPDVAGLMIRLAAADAESVLDPACGMGGLLLAAGAPRLLGQDVNHTVAQLAAVRLLLRGRDARIVAGDALRGDGFPGEQVDAVVCDPPFNERAWGHAELVGDPRWAYGVPPRGESELAWVQHCLAHVRPGGLVAILMPSAAAARRSGRRIRSGLLRAGALRAAITLAAAGPDLWLLRRPARGEPLPASILVADATGDLGLAEAAWRAHLAGEDLPDRARAVQIIDLLDDEVDVGPVRHLAFRGSARDYFRVRDRFSAASAALTAALPDLEALPEPAPGWEASVTTVAELAKAGLVTIHHSSLKSMPEPAEHRGGVPGRHRGDREGGGCPGEATGEGGGHRERRLPLLTADDLMAGGRPSGSIPPAAGLVTTRPGDIVVSPATARVVDEGGAVLGPHLSLLRVDRTTIDPDFLAGFLRFSAARTRAHVHSTRVDARRARVPRLPLSGQRLYGRAFRRLLELEDGVRELASAGQALARAGLEGLASGRLRPRGRAQDGEPG